MSVLPNDKDVLLGRGYAIMAHPGNQTLRTLVRAQKPTFLAAKRRTDKRVVANAIVDEIARRGGRFLVEDPNKNKSNTSALSIGEKSWMGVEREKAVDKVMHRLRERDKGEVYYASLDGPGRGPGAEHAWVGGPAPNALAGMAPEAQNMLMVQMVQNSLNANVAGSGNDNDMNGLGVPPNAVNGLQFPSMGGFGAAGASAAAGGAPPTASNLESLWSSLTAATANAVPRHPPSMAPMSSHHVAAAGSLQNPLHGVGGASLEGVTGIAGGGAASSSVDALLGLFQTRGAQPPPPAGGTSVLDAMLRTTATGSSSLQGTSSVLPPVPPTAAGGGSLRGAWQAMGGGGATQRTGDVVMDGNRSNGLLEVAAPQQQLTTNPTSTAAAGGGALTNSAPTNENNSDATNRLNPDMCPPAQARALMGPTLATGGAVEQGTGRGGCLHLLSSDDSTGKGTSGVAIASEASHANTRHCTSPPSRPKSGVDASSLRIHTDDGVKSEEGLHVSNSVDPRAANDDRITLQEWLQSASAVPSKEAYLLSAVELALFLAKAVGGLLMDGGGGASVNLCDVTADNVVIATERPRPGDDGASPNAGSPTIPIRGVRFLAEGAGAQATPPNPRAACAALGKILVDVFTWNQSSSGSDAPLPKDRTNDATPPPKKRRFAAPVGDEASSNKAHNLLLKLETPLSICQLVGDLLDATNEPCPSTALTSIDDAIFDLACMKANPKSFLFDRTCPERALDDTELFGCGDTHLFGREKELAALMKAKESVSAYVLDDVRAFVGQGNDFICEAAFVGGYAGSGKSSLLLPLMETCNEGQWFVLGCKFDKQVAPVKVLFKMFDDFFGKWGEPGSSNLDSSPLLVESFRKVCGRIIAAIDDDGFDQLADLVPNFTRPFPLVTKRFYSRDEGGGISSMDKVGSGQNRLQKLIHVLLESISSARRPVLIIMDDLQWSDSFVLEGLTDFAVNHSDDSGSVSSCRKGLFIAGTFRSNEVKEDGSLMESVDRLKHAERANVTMLTTGELSKGDVTKLLSAKLCLPWRYTRGLAEVVQSKTRGNPFFIIQFLRSIVMNKMLEFSVRSRRWIWDCDVVDMQMISDDVAGLLAASFNQLPSQLTTAMKVVSCLGYQVERPTIDALDSTNEVLSFRMLDQMELAVKEGILERAGPVYQFTHDIVQQSIYELIPLQSRCPLHKSIGQSLLKSTADNPTIYLLAADQINMFCEDATPSSPEERSQFASCNAVAAKFAIADYSFERARSYIDRGIRLLEPNHWETQYPLSLELYEMSASVSCISGDISTMSTSLQAVLSHVMAFEDSLKASSMLVKLLASNSKYDDARSNCLDILKKLGEEFPSEVSPPLAFSELSGAKTVLEGITYDGIKALPAMTDKGKLHAMKFLNMLCLYSLQSKPMLVPLLSCRMVMLTLEYGFCEDSIVGIATAGFSMFLFTEDIQLAAHLGKVSESLVEECPKKNVLRSRLSFELLSTLKCIRERWHSVLSVYPKYYKSSMVAGDVENALWTFYSHCAGSFWTGAFTLPTALTHATACIKETAKYQMKMIHYAAMAVHNCCSYLSGNGSNEGVEIKSLDELDTIEGRTSLLIWQIFFCRLTQCFWMRNYAAVAALSEEYTGKYPSAQQKRILQVLRTYYEGIVYLHLARGPGGAEKWREMGEKAVETISGYVTSMSKWNFENKALLLRAELHYLDGDLDSAETAYKASIKSAHAHKFIHEEALAYELYGRFCVENQMAHRGVEQLQAALDKYMKWGATRKVDALQLHIKVLLQRHDVNLAA